MKPSVFSFKLSALSILRSQNMMELADTRSSNVRSSRRITADLGDQSGQHQFDLPSASFKSVILMRDQELRVSCERKEVVQFTTRTKREMQKLPEFDSSCPSAPLRDVRWNRIRGASHLTGKPEPFIVGKRRCRPINAKCQRMTLLPHHQLAKILHGVPPKTTASFLALNYYLILITYYYTEVRRNAS